MTSKASACAIASTVVLLAAACSSNTEPGATPLSGSYRVRSINGSPPPGLISQNSQRSVRLVGATLVIGTDNRFVMDDTLQVITSAGSAPQTDHRTGSWTATTGRITFTPDQVGALDVTALDIGSDGTLSLVDPSGSVPVTIVFSR